MKLTDRLIKQYLPEQYRLLSVHSFETIDSTNRAAKEFAAQGNPLPMLVVADCQTAGRGRLGRSFYSPASTGIYMSIVIGGFSTPAHAVFITSAAAVAVTDAIISLTGKNPGIKWVNDIFLNDRKICGILAESQSTPDGFSVVVGIGLNMTTGTFPQEISEIAGSLETDIPKEQMIAEITKNLLELCENPADRSFIEKYRNRSVLIGREINYFTGGEQKSGRAVDIDANGGLVVETEKGEQITLSSGEVTVRIKS